MAVTTTWPSSCAPTATPTSSCARSTCAAIPWTFSGNAGLYGRPEVRLLHRLPARGGPSRRLGERPLPGVVRPLPGAHRRPHALRDLRRPQASLALRRAARGGGDPGAGGGDRARRGRLAIRHLVADLVRYMELGARDADRRAALPVPRRLRLARAACPRRRPRATRRRCRTSRSSSAASRTPSQGAPLRQRPRVREAPRRAHRRRARIRPWPRPTSRRRPCASSPCTRPRASSSRWCSW